jgi:hypothetical protein
MDLDDVAPSWLMRASSLSLLAGALGPAAVPSARSVDAARRRLIE